jgi:hypothetical protein
MRRFGQFGDFDGRICGLILASALVILAPAAGARRSAQGQQAPPSLGTVAKQLRAEKQPAPAGKKVWTNDNLPTNPFGVSVVGQPLPPEENPPADTAKTDGRSAASAKDMPKTQPEMEAELKKETEALALAEKEFDLSKRDFALQQQAFFANAKANQDEAGQAQLAEVQKQLDAMQAELEKARARVAELQLKVDVGQKKATPAPNAGSGTPSGAQ